MANSFHVKVKDMTHKEREAFELHNRKHGLMAKKNMLKRELAEEEEKRLEAADPEYKRLKTELEHIDKRIKAIKLEIRKKHFNALPEKHKRIYSLIGWNPYEDEEKLIRRTTGSFTTKEDK